MPNRDYGGPKSISDLYAYVTTGPDGDEIVSAHHDTLVGPDLAALREAEADAIANAEQGGKSLKLVRFTSAEVIDEWPR